MVAGSSIPKTPSNKLREGLLPSKPRGIETGKIKTAHI
jgi:hypothetical protein